MYEKIKKFFKKFWKLVISILTAIVFFMLGRRSVNGSGVQPIDEGLDRCKGAAEKAERQNSELGKRLDNCQKDTGELRQENREIGKRLEQCQDTAAGIRDDNQGIAERLDNSIKILQDAKKRAEKGEA